jgi:glutamyl-tRNA synthetase
MTDRPVRVRIGPSPTGEPHVGTAWIALFNLAFARKHGGKFVLRIEDTDRERSKLEWEHEIMAGLRWLGLEWDEGPDVGGPFGPYRQSERQKIHAEHAFLLLEKGHAYRCFCTAERLDHVREAQKKAKAKFLGYDRHCRELDPAAIKANLDAGLPFTLRMKFPVGGKTIVPDLLRGNIEWDNEQTDDQILLKSDGFPTYHLANVVDDHLMQISHVIRAEEWISSTPKHVVLYQMFGWEAPVFVHMPLLRNKDSSKISKRKNPVSILDYKQRGVLPEALKNYLGTLGFTMPDPNDPSRAKEFFTFEEFSQALDLKRVVLGGPIFDLEKLGHINSVYYRDKLDEEAFFQTIKNGPLADDYVRKITPMLKKRIQLGEQFIPATTYFFSGDEPFDPVALKSKRSFAELEEIFEAYAAKIDAQIDFSVKGLEEMTNAFTEANGWTKKDLFSAIRTSLTGREATPELFDVMHVLGRALIRRRLRWAIEAFKKAKVDHKQRQDKEASEAKKAQKQAEKDRQQHADIWGAYGRPADRMTGKILVKNAPEIWSGTERLKDHALVIEGGRVAWIGPQADLQNRGDGAEVYDAKGSAILPALVDCHTHLLYGGDRIEDFDRRSRGMTYAEIFAQGGGIHSTVAATRATNPHLLKMRAEQMLERRVGYGIGTTEIKSGYGLEKKTELAMLEAIAGLKKSGWDVEATLLAAHARPRDRDGAEYVKEICDDMIPAVAEKKLARFVDVFVEKNAYTLDEAKLIFAAAKKHGLHPRIHADQITSGAGAELAAEVGAASADHLEHASDAGLAALAKAGVVAVLLPGAMTYLGEHAKGLGKRLIAAGVEVAVATDANPGSSPTNNLPLMATLAVTQMGLTTEQALRAITLGGAHALKRDDIGHFGIGARGDFLVLNAADARSIVASFGEPIIKAFVKLS